MCFFRIIVHVEFLLSDNQIFTHSFMLVLLDVFSDDVQDCRGNVLLSHHMFQYFPHLSHSQSGLVINVSVFNPSSELETRESAVTGTSFGFCNSPLYQLVFTTPHTHSHSHFWEDRQMTWQCCSRCQCVCVCVCFACSSGGGSMPSHARSGERHPSGNV